MPRTPIDSEDLIEALGAIDADDEKLEGVAAFLDALADATAEELFEAIVKAKREVAEYLKESLAEDGDCRTCGGHGGGPDAALLCLGCSGSGRRR